MATLNTLKRQARKIAASRGHDLSPFSKLHHHAASAHCTNPNCISYVFTDNTPMPNSAEIVGSAVAVNCPETVEQYLGRPR